MILGTGKFPSPEAMRAALAARGAETLVVELQGSLFFGTTDQFFSEIESDLPHGAVVEEIEPGYRLHEKVLRPARVIVSKGT